MNAQAPEIAAGGGVAVYEDVGGELRVEVRLDRGTVWLTPDDGSIRQHARERADAPAQHNCQPSRGFGMTGIALTNGYQRKPRRLRHGCGSNPKEKELRNGSIGIRLLFAR